MEDENNDKSTEKCEHEGWADIKDKKRHCTDTLLLLFLVASWVAMTLLGLIVVGAIQDENLQPGNPYRLVNAIDSSGRICGIDPSVADKPYGYYLLDTSAVCISKCPTTTDYTVFHCKDTAVTYAAVSQANGFTAVNAMMCMYQIKTKEYLNRCISDTDNTVAAAGAATAASGVGVTLIETQYNVESTSWFTNFLGDVYSNRAIIFGIGIGAANVVAFLYLFILRLPGVLFFAIWGVLLTIQFVLLIGAILLMNLATTWKDAGTYDENEIMMMQIVSYIVLGLAVLYACLLCVMRSRVQLAIAVVKQAARAIQSMPALIAMPIVQAIGLCLFLVPWIIYSIYLASSGELKTIAYEYPPGFTRYYREFEYTDNTRYAFLYMLFTWFWTSQFIIAFGQLSIALAIVSWYFTHQKENIDSSNVYWAMTTCGKYHMGTAAFGSLLIAIVKTIRAVIAYIQKKANDSGNKFLVCVMSCLQCCMWCLEKCMKFLNKNAYIQTAIYGYGFCHAAKQAFGLIMRNILRVAAVNMVADFILFLGRLFIPVVTTLIAYLALAYGGGDMSGLILPLIFVFLLSYFIGCMYSEIFGMSIETILICYIADEEMFEPELRFAEAELRSTMQITAQKAAEGQVHPENDKGEVQTSQSSNNQVKVTPAANDSNEEALL